MRDRVKIIKRDGLAVEVRTASVLMGVRRVLVLRDLKVEEEGDEALRYLKVLYANLISCSSPIDGFGEWPIGFDKFCELPETFVTEWASAVFEINRDWDPSRVAVDDVKKS